MGVLRSLSATPPRLFFFFNDTATTEIYTLSLHDALPILFQDHQFVALTGAQRLGRRQRRRRIDIEGLDAPGQPPQDRKSTRLNSSHSQISYAVFCLKKKKKTSYGTLRTSASNGTTLRSNT